jgi:glutathione synthase/RimK-type ligase-like ATP-grasp enzyme
MRNLIVVNRPEKWPFDIPDVELVAARTYLTDPSFTTQRGVRVYNLCRSYRYQTVGYYVSLLAEARGHRPLPRVATTQDLKSPVVARILSGEVDDLIQRSLESLKTDRFVLSIYFARNTAQVYDRLCQQLYNQFQAPLLRAIFVRRDRRWGMQDISAISAEDVPVNHRDFVAEVAKRFFARRHITRKPKVTPRYYLAILYDPQEQHQPSNDRAIQKFERAAEKCGLQAEVISRDDYSRLAEFDALFIRQTTSVNHFTFRFSSRAQAEGLVVIDDPVSILRCTNKVYLAELLDRHDIPGPKTMIVHRDNLDKVCDQVGFPIILKQPDSAFSQGVKKVKDRAEFDAVSSSLFKDTELLIAQEFIKTEFDWRIGVLDRKPIYAAKYFMARKHWQIIANAPEGEADYGKVAAVPVELVPPAVIRVAVKAAGLIGNGLYGVDVKQVDRSPYVIEVNDNPSIDAGYEDTLLKDTLYERIMEHFVQRLDRRRERRTD